MGLLQSIPGKDMVRVLAMCPTTLMRCPNYHQLANQSCDREKKFRACLQTKHLWAPFARPSVWITSISSTPQLLKTCQTTRAPVCTQCQTNTWQMFLLIEFTQPEEPRCSHNLWTSLELISQKKWAISPSRRECFSFRIQSLSKQQLHSQIPY